jgi:nicotinamidase-related amidase
MEYQQYDITPARNIIPLIQEILTSFRSHGFPIYHTREGHRPDLSTLSSRELFRSRNNASGLGIGDKGPMGRLLIRGEKGHDIVDDLTPLDGENIIDKPGRSAFQHTDFKLMLNIKGIKNLGICGVTTDVCVHSTLREANDNGFDCVLVGDASAASTGPLHEFAIESIKEEGGIFGAVTSSNKILAALGVKQDEKPEVAANGPIQSNGAEGRDNYQDRSLMS